MLRFSGTVNRYRDGIWGKIDKVVVKEKVTKSY